MSSPDEDARAEAYVLLDALEEMPRSERLAGAIRVIRIDPSLGEAYTAVAAALPQDRPEALAAWLAACEIARRDAGVTPLHNAGRPGHSVNARAYLRACLGYALCAVENGDFDEAVSQLTRLLSHDADDRIGARFSLGPALLLGRRFDAFEVFRQSLSTEDSAYWLYADAFHAVAVKAPAAVRKARLKRALASNAHAPGFMLHEDPHRMEPAAYAAPGSAEEGHALACSVVGRLWRENAAALTVLARAFV